MGAQENVCQISQNDKKIVFGVITDNKLYLWPLKSAKKNALLFKLFWHKIFVH